MDGTRRALPCPVVAGARTYGRLPMLALAGTLMLEQGERLSLSQSLDGLKVAFSASDTALGGIAAAMTVVGAVGSLPFGWLADRTRRTALLAGAMAVWTACMGLAALAPGLVLLYVSRIGLGFVEANGPAAVSLIADYHPVQERGRAMSRYQAGSAVGGGIGLGLGGVLIGAFGFRAGFWMWVPLGVVVTVLLLRSPEPVRGSRDADVADDLHEGEDPAGRAGLELPAPTRVGTIDYETAGPRECVREILRIRSMWFAVVAITVSHFFLVALGYWGVEYFKREFGFSEEGAGGFAVLLGAGSFVGLVGGGWVADRLLRRGVLRARVLVPAVSSILAAILVPPAFLSSNLWVVGPLFAVAGVLFTLPVAPAEALMTDVVPGPLRGRAASARAVVRSIAAASPLAIGALSDALGEDLGMALALTSPLFAIGGVVMLFASRTYPTDLAYVAAEGRRVAADLTPVSHSEP